MAGWKFKVLTPIFAIHWDLQTLASIRSPPQLLRTNLHHMRNAALSSVQPQTMVLPRHLQTSRNYIKYKSFVREVCL